MKLSPTIAICQNGDHLVGLNILLRLIFKASYSRHASCTSVEYNDHDKTKCPYC